MAGHENDISFSLGHKLQASTAQAITLMQDAATDVSFLNTAGTPEASVSANVGSLALNRTDGEVYIKTSGTGNTGWEKLESGTDVPIIFDTDGTSTSPVANTITFTGTPGIVTSSTVAGVVTISITGSAGFTWTDVTGTSDTMVAANGYVANNAALVTLTLPETCTLGDVFKVISKGAGFVRVAQNASQTIRFAGTTSTSGVGGYIEATAVGDSVEIVCTADDEFYVTSSIGNWTIV